MEIKDLDAFSERLNEELKRVAEEWAAEGGDLIEIMSRNLEEIVMRLTEEEA